MRMKPLIIFINKISKLSSSRILFVNTLEKKGEKKHSTKKNLLKSSPQSTMNHQRPHRKGTIQSHAESWTSEGHCEGIVHDSRDRKRKRETEKLFLTKGGPMRGDDKPAGWIPATGAARLPLLSLLVAGVGEYGGRPVAARLVHQCARGPVHNASAGTRCRLRDRQM